MGWCAHLFCVAYALNQSFLCVRAFVDVHITSVKHVH